MTESGGKRRWLRYGCFGCLGVLGLIAAIAVTISGIGYNMARNEQIEDRSISPTLPAGPPEVAPPDSTPARSVPPGDVVLDLRHGDFVVEPALAGEPLRVDASFDEKLYRLDEAFESDSDGWTYRVGFRRTGSALFSGLKELFGGTAPKIRVYLPPDVRIGLTLTVMEGASEVELGGLWLSALDIELGRGESRVHFSEPLREPLERATVRASMGGMFVRDMGNASPRELTIDLSMCGLEMDLGGAWTRDAEISITSRMAGGLVRLPEGVRFEGLDRAGTGVNLPETSEFEPPTLRFSLSTEMGEIEFID